MANKYHVSKDSGRANICRATKKGCPLGADTPHFESKAEANAYIEASAKAEHSTIPATVKKGRGRPRKNAVEEVVATDATVENVDDFDEAPEDDYIDRTAQEAEKFALKNASRYSEFSERESRIMKKFISTDKAFDGELFKETLEYSLEAERDDYAFNDDDYDDYNSTNEWDFDDDVDTEINYTGNVIVDREAVVNRYYKDLKTYFGENELSPNEESQAKGIIKKVLKKHDLLEDWNYTPVITNNTVESFTPLGGVDDAMSDFRKIFNS